MKYNIGKFAEGTLDQLSMNLFERKMQKDKAFRKKVRLYQKVNSVMKGAAMAAAAEAEMVDKKIDIVANDFVSDYFTKKEKAKKDMKFLSWS